MEEQTGATIRALRKERSMTLTQLSKSTGLSVGFLSNLERGETSPTIANLHKICEALDITLNDILGKADNAKAEAPTESLPFTLIKAQDRPSLFRQPDQGLSYESMTTASASLKCTAMTVSGESWVVFSPHDHDELGIVAEGSMQMNIGGQAVTLSAGDCVFIPQGTMHSALASGDAPCISYWVKQAQ